ncbi:MAG: GFA family protein [Stenotrophobium sp.]
MLHSGSCLCSAVRYELDAPVTEISVCHCRMCRKASGSAFVAVAPVASEKFRFVAGGEQIKAYESSPGKKRWFCRVCASPVYSESILRPGMVRIRLGTLDTPVGHGPSYHIYVADKADWDEIHDGLPQYPAHVTTPTA